MIKIEMYIKDNQNKCDINHGNVFMFLKWFELFGFIAIILISRVIAFFGYCFQVPANRIGYQ